MAYLGMFPLSKHHFSDFLVEHILSTIKQENSVFKKQVLENMSFLCFTYTPIYLKQNIQ